MLNFSSHIPTAIHFGKGAIAQLGPVLAQYRKKVLLIYGKGSVQRNGVYQQTVEQLRASSTEWIEFSGIKPNPLAQDVDAAALLGLQNQVELVLAIGGGSVIDSAKIIALCIASKAKAWDVMTHQVKQPTALPLVAVLTLAATGTEMNAAAVLQNHDTQEKLGYVHPCIYPAHSFLDPEYTYTVPRPYTAYGIADMVAHTLENFFGNGDAPLSDKFTVALLREALEVGPALLDSPNDYALRARAMWAATMALNGTNNYGKSGGDWGVHNIGHHMSLLFDTPHGASLTIAFPAWMRLQAERIPQRIEYLGREVFGVESCSATIEAFEAFFHQLECPIRLREIGLDTAAQDLLLTRMLDTHTSGYAQPLNADDLRRLAHLMES